MLLSQRPRPPLLPLQQGPGYFEWANCSNPGAGNLFVASVLVQVISGGRAPMEEVKKEKEDAEVQQEEEEEVEEKVGEGKGKETTI